jgi:hypothetical protein
MSLRERGLASSNLMQFIVTAYKGIHDDEKLFLLR